MTMTEGAINTAKAPIVLLRERLENRIGELEAALPEDVTPKQFIRAVMTSASLNADILACTWQSVWNACLRACRDGLLPDGIEGAIVPYRDRTRGEDKANWIPMYQGLLRRFRRSGQFKWVAADVVREGEPFEHYRDTTGEHFRHVPGTDDSQPVVFTYACAITKDDAFFIAVMSNAEIDKVKKMSRAQRDDAPWRQWEDEMRKKTALRRLHKLLPSSRDLIPSEDDNEIDEDDIGKRSATAPPIGARMLLDQFVSNEPKASTPATTGAEGGGGTTEGEPQMEALHVPDRTVADKSQRTEESGDGNR